MQDIPEQLKMAGDGVAAGVTIAAILNWIPHLAALASLVYALIRIYETETIQKFVKKIFKKR